MVKRSPLLEKCQRLRRMLEAATDPVEGGRRIRDNVDATAISRATDELYVAASAATMRIAQHGRRVSAIPGIVVEASNSPHGPFTPIPQEAVTITACDPSDRGTPYPLWPAIWRVREATAFPLALWNQMQAIRPGGDHQRFRAGDVITNEQLHRLAQAEDLLLQAEEFHPGWDAGIYSEDQPIDKVAQCTPSHVSVGALPTPTSVDEGGAPAERRQTVQSPVAAAELSLPEAAIFYADLTGTKPDRSNSRKRLGDEKGRYTIEYIALRARNAIKRKSGRKRRELMSESDSPQQCSRCGATVRPPDVLWGSGHLCDHCRYLGGRK